MSSKIKIDYLIVGQGLAGSVLAFEFLKRGKRILVLDEPEKNRASVIAAGLVNPVTGKLMTRTWLADDLFSCLFTFYSEVEHLLKRKIFSPMSLYRPFISIEEQNEWMGKSTEPGMLDYIDQIFVHSTFGSDVNDPFGGLLLKKCGYLDITEFIKGVRDQLISKESYKLKYFDEEKITFVDEGVEYDDVCARKIIYANGLGTLHSKFFGNLPLRSLKGETLLIEMEHETDRVYNRGVYIVPTSAKGIYKVGATYNTKSKEDGTTSEGKIELTEKLDNLLRINYKIVGQEWGFRPTTPDRRPMLGAHRHHPSLVMFNGLGTKGVSLAPFFARQLINWLEGTGEIEPAVNLNRFY